MDMIELTHLDRRPSCIPVEHIYYLCLYIVHTMHNDTGTGTRPQTSLT